MKRPASESVIPPRPAKHARTTPTHSTAGDTSASQIDGILSRWKSLTNDLRKLAGGTLAIFRDAPKNLESLPFSLPASYPLHQLRNPSAKDKSGTPPLVHSPQRSSRIEKSRESTTLPSSMPIPSSSTLSTTHETNTNLVSSPPRDVTTKTRDSPDQLPSSPSQSHPLKLKTTHKTQHAHRVSKSPVSSQRLDPKVSEVLPTAPPSIPISSLMTYPLKYEKASNSQDSHGHSHSGMIAAGPSARTCHLHHAPPISSRRAIMRAVGASPTSTMPVTSLLPSPIGLGNQAPSVLPPRQSHGTVRDGDGAPLRPTANLLPSDPKFKHPLPLTSKRTVPNMPYQQRSTRGEFVLPAHRSSMAIGAAHLPLRSRPKLTEDESSTSTPPVAISSPATSIISSPNRANLHGEVLNVSVRPFPDGIPRKYRNREHIYAKAHKATIQADRKKDREELAKKLYNLNRHLGYSSDYPSFQSYMHYRARLEQLGRRDILPTSPSLTNLRSESVAPDTRRRHSFSDELNPEFLARAIQKARDTLNGPPPPKPFIPSFEELRRRDRVKDEEIERRLRGPKRTLPTALPGDAETAVDAILAAKGIVSKFAREQVTDKDLSRLRPRQWLNDEIVNFYGQLILSRSDACRENPGVNGAGKNKALNVHYFSTFFWSKLKGEGYEKGRLAKWTKKFDLFQKDIVLVPVNHDNTHWTSAAINFRRKRIESYDSMNMDQRQVYMLLRSYLDAEHRNKKKKPFDFTGWEDHTLLDTPQQENGYDCGVFTCQFLESLARGEEAFNFSQQDIAYLRRKMIWEIGNATLRDET